MRVINYFILLMGLVLFQSCEKELPPTELMQFVNSEEHGLLRKKVVSPVSMEVLYKPIDYIIAQEFRRKPLNEAAYEQRKKALEGAQYFNLKLTIDNFAQRQHTDKQFLYYLSYQMKNDIRLIEGQDTLAPILYHFERSYDIAAHRTFVLAFEASEKETVQDKTFILDSEPLNTGPMKISFLASDLTNTPTIKF